MKFIIDKAISLNSEENGGNNDLLHTKQYADILLQGIKDAPQGEAYTIGLFGEWGSGKSSVIETMTANAAKDNELKKFKIVNYDAWKYSGDSFRRMFLYELRNTLNIKESPLMQRFYVNETNEVEIKPTFNCKKFGIIVAFCVVAAILVVALKCIYGYEVAIPSTVALVALLFSLWTFVFDQLKMTIQKPLLFAPEQFEECYKEIVGCSTKWDKYKEKALKWITLGVHHVQYQRIVIVIDNIDRCQPDKAYTLLTDIKNFLCKEFDVIFIVPVDIYALRKHILKQSSDNDSIDADEFLRKFFNTSIWMKAYQNGEMYDFAYNIAQKNQLGYRPDTITLVANEFATNPRRIIQLFNNLQIELSLYSKEFAEEHQALICKLLIIREEFPLYYRQIMAKPSLLFDDVALIRVKVNQTDEEKALLANTRLYAFLLSTSGVSSRYEKKGDVVSRILVNYQPGNSLPENIHQAYRTANADELEAYAKDSKNRELLLNYLQDNIKRMVSRQSIDAEGKLHFDILLQLFEKSLLTSDDKKRLFEPLESEVTLSKLIGLYKDKEPLIKLGKDLESLNLPKLTASLENKFRHKDITEEEMTEVDAKNIFFAASLWSKERCKNISEKFFEALESFPVECRSYSFSKDKYPALFTEEVYKFIFENLSADNCNDEKSTFKLFQHLCQIQAISIDKLTQFVEKATEKAPAYDYKKPQEIKPQNYLKALSEIFAEISYLGHVVPVVKMTGLFDKINNQSTETITVNYSRTENKHHSFISEKASDEFVASIIIEFFTNVNLITNGAVISNAEVERFMKVDANHDKVLESLIYLKGQGVDVSTWTNAVLTDQRRTDIRRIEILKSTFVKKNEEGSYEVADNVVKSEVNELINIIQSKAEGYEALTKMFEDVLNDERINKLVREVLATKKLEDQKLLPPSLMQRATESFEHHIQELTIPKDVNVLQIIATHGSDEGIDGVWSLINPILADGKNQSPNTINGAIQVLLSFSRMTKQQADALIGNVKALQANKISEEKKKEILKYIEECQI